jgi:hypothetical protein
VRRRGDDGAGGSEGAATERERGAAVGTKRERERGGVREGSAGSRVRAGGGGGAATARVRRTGANRPVYREYRWYRWSPVPVCTGTYRSDSNALNLNSKN